MNNQNRRTTDDVRMHNFARQQSVERALAWLDAQLQPLDSEPVPLRITARRVLAESIVSNVDVPNFDRATMDGYALAAESTEGATSYNRLPLTVIGDSLPGRPFPHHVSPGQAVRIMTGAPMPQGCDAVLPAEWVDSTEATSTDERSECKPDRAQPSGDERSECKPDRAQPSSDERSECKPDRAQPSSDERSECKPDRAQPSSDERSECKPDRAQPSRDARRSSEESSSCAVRRTRFGFGSLR